MNFIALLSKRIEEERMVERLRERERERERSEKWLG